MKLAIVRVDELVMAVSVEMLEHEENRRYGLCRGRDGLWRGEDARSVRFVTGTASIFRRRLTVGRSPEGAGATAPARVADCASVRSRACRGDSPNAMHCVESG